MICWLTGYEKICSETKKCKSLFNKKKRLWLTGYEKNALFFS